MAKIVVGMSGGVDSSLASALLKEQGHEVIGLFMRNWREKDENGCCTADADFQDVKDVCNKLDIPYYSVDFSEQYYDRVFKHFLDEYSAGRTPNPDVLCNKEIKFDAFLNYAIKVGADYVATGHYCNVRHEVGRSYLLRAIDDNKDQTYFLNQLTSTQLDKVLFPLGDIDKPQVRELASKYGLSVADKKDSTGICFIGERNFRQFLSQYIPMQNGKIKDTDGNVVGEHSGVFYYTIGQRRGLGIGGKAGGSGDRWFVLDKDILTNTLIVSHGETDILYKQSLETNSFNFISGYDDFVVKHLSQCEVGESADSDNIQCVGSFRCMARIRHRQALQHATAYVRSGGGVKVVFDDKQRAICQGQYVVLYIDNVCIGGGVIERC